MNSVFSAMRIAGALIYASGCGGPQPDFERVLERAVRETARTNGATIQLASITTFAWDKVFIFHPYMAPEAIDKELGFRWQTSLKEDLEYNDAFELLAFVRAGEVVESAKVPREVADWALNSHNGFRPDEAEFLVERPAGTGATVLRVRVKK